MKLIPASLSRSIGLRRLALQKNSPSILFVGGLAGVLGGTVLACRATLKLEKTLDEAKAEIDLINDDTDAVKGRDLSYAYAKHGLTILKLYGPAVICTSAGVVMLTRSHNTLMQRNASLTAAYAVVTEAFDAYRGRVRDEVGEERESQLYRGQSIVTVGSGKDAYQACMTSDALSPYAVWWDESVSSFQPNGSMNLQWVKGQENFANDRLHLQGWLLLNDVYTALGLPPTSAGAVVGWLSDPQNGGDGYIDFGLEEAKATMLVTGEHRFILDFNVDGNIYESIDDFAPWASKFSTAGRRIKR